MKFKIDENLPREIAPLLRDVGHDAVDVQDQGLAGAGDPDIFAVCALESRILVTLDVDFANIKIYPPAKGAGIIVLRLQQQDKPHVLKAVRRIVPFIESDPPEKKLWILEEHRLRIYE
ncbi:MAG: DUF5615 family PIN-like protein [Magnetococcales bacterium]|nr:DUF5615 family PIN-like protein [Magnetococcales bacterium]